jgi:two-component system phosphate regulon sensor histidine kinase PhoR
MPEKAAPMIHEGFKSLTDGVQFVQSILMGSSAQSGAIVYNMQPVDFKTIVLETTEKERVKAEEKGLKFELNIGEGSFQVNGDNLQLREAVRNLIDNSIVYTFKGGLEIDLSVVNSKLLLVVKDTGIGISSEDKLRLFTKGGRGRDSMKVNVNSSGYGLAFVKAVMEAHKGCVWAESEGHGMGSKFTMELPVK